MNLKLEEKFDIAFKSIFIFIFIFAANFLVLSPPGEGLIVSPNAAIWICLALVILLAIFKILLTGKIRISKIALPFILVSCLLISLGLIETKSDIREISFRVLQVVGFCFVFLAITQFTFTQREINFLFYVIVCAAIIQIIYGTTQLLHNAETTPQFLLPFLGIKSPPFGGILQVNMMSMFLSISILISIFLYSQPSFNSRNILFKASLAIAMFGGGFLISVISSRASIVVLIISIPLLILSRWKGLRNKKFWGGLLISSLIVGSFIGSFSDFKKLSHKTMMPRTVVWDITLDSIKEKPIFGYGLGGFTKAFFDENEKYVADLEDNDYRIKSFFTHPHNEILYWWVESGIGAVLAIIGLVLIYLKQLFKLRWRYSLQYVTLIFPLALHTQVSLPFYLSSLLMVLFLFLITIPIRSLENVYTVKIKESTQKIVSVLSLVIFFTYFWFVKEVIIGGMNMTKFGISGLRDYSLIEKELGNPYWGKLSSIYLRQELMKQLFLSGDKVKAREYLDWFEEQLYHNEKPIYYKYLLSGYELFDEKDKYDQLRSRLKNRYPDHFLE